MKTCKYFFLFFSAIILVKSAWAFCPRVDNNNIQYYPANHDYEGQDEEGRWWTGSFPDQDAHALIEGYYVVSGWGPNPVEMSPRYVFCGYYTSDELSYLNLRPRLADGYYVIKSSTNWIVTSDGNGGYNFTCYFQSNDDKHCVFAWSTARYQVANAHK